MTDALTILALDVATTTGWCVGAGHERYTSGTKTFAGGNRGAVLCATYAWMVKMLERHRPGRICVETPFAKRRGLDADVVNADGAFRDAGDASEAR